MLLLSVYTKYYRLTKELYADLPVSTTICKIVHYATGDFFNCKSFNLMFRVLSLMFSVPKLKFRVPKLKVPSSKLKVPRIHTNNRATVQTKFGNRGEERSSVTNNVATNFRTAFSRRYTSTCCNCQFKIQYS